MNENDVKLQDVIEQLIKIKMEYGNLNCFGDYDSRAVPLTISVGDSQSYKDYPNDVYGVHFT